MSEEVSNEVRVAATQIKQENVPLGGGRGCTNKTTYNLTGAHLTTPPP